MARRVRHWLSNKHHGGFEKDAAARAASRGHLHLQPRLDLAARFSISAVEALNGSARPVELDDSPAARVLVQTIGVLRRDCDQVTAGLEGGERVVARVWPGC